MNTLVRCRGIASAQLEHSRFTAGGMLSSSISSSTFCGGGGDPLYPLVDKIVDNSVDNSDAKPVRGIWL